MLLYETFHSARELQTSDVSFRPLEMPFPGEIVLGWYHIDARNNLGAGITNLTFEYVNYKTGLATGLTAVDDGGSTTFSFDGTDVSVGLWRVRANYTNKYEGLPSGTPVSAYSEVFIVFNDINYKCAADEVSLEEVRG